MMRSCQGWPPSAIGMRPAALSLSMAGKNSSQCLGRLGACFLERRGRTPHPVLAVHIDGDRIDLAVAGDRIEKSGRQEVAPLAFGRHLRRRH